MAGGGRRKPTKLKAIQGTLQPCRTNQNEPVPNLGIANPPDYLVGRTLEKFRQLSAILDRMCIASPDDIDALGNLSCVLVEIEEDVTLLAGLDGPYYTPSKESGIIRSHPAVARLAANRQRAQALLNEFGLTPAARSKVSASTQKDSNPFVAFG